MRACAGPLTPAYQQAFKQARRRVAGLSREAMEDAAKTPLLPPEEPPRSSSLTSGRRRSGQSLERPDAPPARLLSLDITRGLTIALMLFVNHAGHAPWWLSHAEWNGVHVADFVMPGFLVIMGASISLSTAVQKDRGHRRRLLLGKALARAAKLFALGLFIQGGVTTGRFPSFDLSTLRIMGVLQRIALCYLAVSLAALWAVPGRRELKEGLLSEERQPPELPEPLTAPVAPSRAAAVCQARLWVLAGTIWAAYNALSLSLKAPGCAAGGSFSAACNFAHWFDTQVLRPEHMYPYATCRQAQPPCAAFDPEGLWTTLGGAMSSTAAGAALGAGFLAPRPPAARTRQVAGTAAAALAAGLALTAFGLSPNKNLWSGSFSLLTFGAVSLAFAACHWAADQRKSTAFRLATSSLVWLGTNPIAVFFGDEVLDMAFPLVYWKQPENNLRDWLWRAVVAKMLGPGTAGWLAGAAIDVLFWTGIAGWLYRRRIFFKV